jgi:hypothetical protein
VSELKRSHQKKTAAVVVAAPEQKHGEYDVFYLGREELGVDLPEAPPAGTLARKTSEPSKALLYDGKQWQR